MSSNAGKLLSKREAAKRLSQMIERAAKDGRLNAERFGTYLEAFWYFCHGRRGWLDGLYIPVRTLQSFPAARERNGGSPYIRYQQWLSENGYVTMIMPGQKGANGRKGVAAIYEVQIPMCKGNPWPLVDDMLRESKRSSEGRPDDSREKDKT